MKAFWQQHDEANSPPESQAVTDGQLLERFIERADQAAFATLVQVHGPMVLGVCRRITAHHHDAEEAFQAAFLVVARKAGAVRPRHMIANWLYGVAYREALKVRTASVRRRAKEKQVATMLAPAAPQTVDWSELAPLLDRELNRLSDPLRAAVVSCDIEGRSRLEAARQLGWPEGTLKVRLSRARAILARRLARQGVVLSVGTLAAVVTQNAASAGVPAVLAASTVQAAAALAASTTQAAGAGDRETVPSTAMGMKGTALAKGWLSWLFLGHPVVATTAATVTLAAALFATAPQLRTSPEQKSAAKLPADVQRALEENAQQLSPISVQCTSRTDMGKLKMTYFVNGKDVTASVLPAQHFRDQSFHVVWQDQKYCLSERFLSATPGDARSAFSSEVTFDGRVYCVGNVPDRPEGANVPPPMSAANSRGKSKPASLDPDRRELLKVPVAAALRMELSGIGGKDPYFRPEIGFVVALDPHATRSGEKIIEQKLQAESAILSYLHKGGTLISVENVVLDGKPCVRVELEVANPVGRPASNGAVTSNSTVTFNSTAAPNRSAKAGDENQTAAATPPEARRYIYYLDPSLHYAVRRLETRSKPDTLLNRTDCSQFEQIAGRQLWLPRKVESELHELPMLPGAVLKKEEAATQTLEVSAFDGSRVPDETFVLNYTQPGTIVHDGTDAGSTKFARGFIRYTAPARRAPCWA